MRIVLGANHGHTLVLAAHGVLLCLALVAVLAPGVPRWFVAWLPIAALPLLYTELPVIIAAVGRVGTFDAAVTRWDAAVFGGVPAADWARAWPSMLFSEGLHAAYASYYLVVVSVPALLFVGSRHRDYSEALFVLLLTFVACFLVYAAFPVEGPRYRGVESMPGVIRAAVLWLLERGSARGTAFPSSHVAVAVTQSILATRYFGKRGALLWIPAIGLGGGAVYGGFHYAVDVLAGLVVGALMTTIGLTAVRLARRAQPTQANATAPM